MNGTSLVVMNKPTLAYVTSAYNETLNLEELHRRCRLAWHSLAKEVKRDTGQELGFRMVIADNHSSDDTLATMQHIIARDPEVIGIANAANYGPDASFANVLKQASNCDLVVLLCSDLQDPPELSVKMVQRLLKEEFTDAVLAIKSRSAGGPLLRMARRGYYRALGISSRLQLVPSGFHGFGCYRREVVDEVLRYWEESGLNLRMCISNACQNPARIEYQQPDRTRGKSSYAGSAYLLEAARALLSADAAASRLALSVGSTGTVLALLVGVFLLANYLSGNSRYQGGVPTVMGLVLMSFGLQMLMFAVMSRQIESLRMSGFRPRVRTRQIQGSKGQDG
jgi:glycosyltransferase involved in cell wall biosynthesis